MSTRRTQDPAGNASSNPPPLQPSQAPSGHHWVAGLREITTTVIAGVVLLVTTWMLWLTFDQAGSWADKKDVMLYALPILGSIIGYYFGRVPAERRAETAEESREKAEEKLSRARTAIDHVKMLLEPSAATQRKSAGSAAGAGESERFRDALAELEAISRVL